MSDTSWQAGYEEGRRIGSKLRLDEIDQLQAELAALKDKAAVPEGYRLVAVNGAFSGLINEREAVKEFTKRPVTISAIQWTGDNLRAVITFIEGAVVTNDLASAARWDDYRDLVEKRGLVIKTLEGQHIASVGDWIIKGVKGEHYPCKPDIFEMTYAPAQQSDKFWAEKLADNSELRRLCAERDQLRTTNQRLREALADLLESPASVVQATVPRAGIEMAPPYQVVLDVSVSLTRWRKAQAALSTANGGVTK